MQNIQVKVNLNHRKDNKMLTQIVVLYMAFIYDLPTWCKVFLIISLCLNIMGLGYKTCKSMNGTGDTK